MKKAYLSLILLTVAVSAVAQWKPAGDNIMSAWAEDVNPASVHQEYPRPQMVREQWMKTIPLRRGGTGEDVAKVAVFLGSDLSSYVTGQTIHCCGGMSC